MKGIGGFLSKKSFHTGTLRNQERVWKAEQRAKAERQRIEELQRQLEEERQMQELRQLQAAGGHSRSVGEERLNWMYRAPLDNGPSTDDLLLGKATLDDKEEVKEAMTKTALERSTAHEPSPVAAANEMWVKMHEDPLLAMKRRQQEGLASIRSNPVQMARIRALLMEERSKKRSKKKAKKERKKAKKKAKKRKKQQRKHDDGNRDTKGPTEAAVGGSRWDVAPAATRDTGASPSSAVEQGATDSRRRDPPHTSSVRDPSPRMRRSGDRRDSEPSHRHGRARRRSRSRSRSRSPHRRRHRRRRRDDDGQQSTSPKREDGHGSSRSRHRRRRRSRSSSPAHDRNGGSPSKRSRHEARASLPEDSAPAALPRSGYGLTFPKGAPPPAAVKAEEKGDTSEAPQPLEAPRPSLREPARRHRRGPSRSSRKMTDAEREAALAEMQGVAAERRAAHRAKLEAAARREVKETKELMERDVDAGPATFIGELNKSIYLDTEETVADRLQRRQHFVQRGPKQDFV